MKYVYICGLIGVLCVSICQAKSYTHLELITQPKILEKAIMACKNLTSDYCQQVENAHNVFSHLMLEHQLNPEAFGEHLLQLEIQKAALASTEEKQSQLLTEEIRSRLAVIGMSGP